MSTNRLWLNSTLETERCILKIPQESEAGYMWNLIEESTTKYMPWEKWETPEGTLNNIKEARENTQNWELWDAAVYDKNTEKCIWRCGIVSIKTDVPSCEIGYWIAPKYYGQGIIPECVYRLLQFTFQESNFEKVIIWCVTKNENSRKVAIKCGFTHEGTFKNYERIRWNLYDNHFFGITRKEYQDKILKSEFGSSISY